MQELQLGPFINELVSQGWTPSSFFREAERKSHTFTLSFNDLKHDNILLLHLEACSQDVVGAEPMSQESYRVFEDKTVLTVVEGNKARWVPAKNRRKGRRRIQFDLKYISEHGFPSNEQANELLAKGYMSPPFIRSPLPKKKS